MRTLETCKRKCQIQKAFVIREFRSEAGAWGGMMGLREIRHAKWGAVPQHMDAKTQAPSKSSKLIWGGGAASVDASY